VRLFESVDETEQIEADVALERLSISLHESTDCGRNSNRA
jgi:hypothetical protein